MNTITLGGVKLSHGEITSAIDCGKSYIIRFNTIYKIKQIGDTWKATKVHFNRGATSLIGRGRFSFATQDHASRIAGVNLK